MNGPPWHFERPAELQATEPPESRGVPRDGVRLMVSSPGGTEHRRFTDLTRVLRRGDLLVVNRSGTIPASLPARGAFGNFVLNLSTAYAKDVWLAEPRWGIGAPGPLPLTRGDELEVAGLRARALSEFPGIPRLWFVRFDGNLDSAIRRSGSPIRYGYLRQPVPLHYYQTIFARHPGSAEMPSAARPFTANLVRSLSELGVEIIGVTLHAGVSSLERDSASPSLPPIFPEPFDVPEDTAQAVNRARREGRRVIAVGTTVVRAVESAWEGGRVRAMRGFTRAVIEHGRPIRVFHGLLTGLHDPRATHLAMLEAFLPVDRLQEDYEAAVRRAYLWHEFGDSHLVLAG